MIVFLNRWFLEKNVYEGVFLNYLPFFIAIIVFLAFIFVFVVTGQAHKSNSRVMLCRFHLGFFLVYVFLAIVSKFTILDSSIGFADWAIGLYCYFALLYSFFFHLYAILQKSVSLVISMTLAKEPVGLSAEDVKRKWNGTGISDEKHFRIDDMVQLKFISRQESVCRCTLFGRMIVRLYDVILVTWNLQRIAAPKKQETI